MIQKNTKKKTKKNKINILFNNLKACITQIHAFLLPIKVHIILIDYMLKNVILDPSKQTSIENPLDTSEYDIMEVSLANFPHKEFTNHVDGKNGPIDFYAVAPDTKVLVLNEETGKLRWSDVKCWSKHESREIEIVNLSNGLQIITDNDPRAVYGLTPEMLVQEVYHGQKPNFKYQRYTPTAALQKGLYIPCRYDEDITPVEGYEPPEYLSKEQLEVINKNVNSLEDVLDIQNTYLTKCHIILQIYVDEANQWKLKQYIPSLSDVKLTYFRDMDYNPDIIYVKIASVDYTLKKETGYDLTVPGYETFMSTNGIVLSNTINVHVPGLPEAVDDTINKLMPSKNIFQIRDLRNIENPIKQDFMISLFTSANTPAQKRYVFKTKEDALRAIKNGTVKLSDEVEFPQ